MGEIRRNLNKLSTKMRTYVATLISYYKKKKKKKKGANSASLTICHNKLISDLTSKQTIKTCRQNYNVLIANIKIQSRPLLFCSYCFSSVVFQYKDLFEVMLFPFGFSISLQQDLFQSHHPYSNTAFPANLVTFTEEILHGKFRSDMYSKFSAGNYMFKVKNRNTRTRCEICSKLTIKIPDIWCLYR